MVSVRIILLSVVVCGLVVSSAHASEPTCRFETVYFDLDSTQLSASQVPSLEAAVACYKAWEQALGCQPTLRVVGHTDTRGSEEYNLAIGRKYSRMVVQWLVKHGVPRAAMSETSAGENDPMYPRPHNEAERAVNRRVTFEVDPACR